MNRRADIVLETGQRQFRGAAAAADRRPRLDELYRSARPGEDYGGGQPVRTGPDYNSINRPISQGR